MTTALEHSRVASVDWIRSQFPALERRHSGYPVAYLDGPGGTQVPRAVAEQMTRYLYEHNANTHWRYPSSEETDALIGDARTALAHFVAGEPDEIVFGANMTTLTFHLARALGRGWGPKDEIVITELDHHANVAPWRALERERGVRVQVVRMRPEDGTLDTEDLERKIGANTRLVAICAASNALGTIVDVRRAAQLARQRGAQVFVDAVHFAPHVFIDVRDLGCDYLVCSAYKFYGPHIGVLWGKRERLAALDVPKLDAAPDTVPERIETGTQNHEGIVGAGAAVDWLASLVGTTLTRRGSLGLVLQELHGRSNALFRQLWDGLGEIERVKRFGVAPDQPRSPTLAFKIAGKTSDEVAIALAERGLFVSHGDFYATTVIERLGAGEDGVVRVGCSVYTNDDEIRRVIDAVRSIAR